MTSESRQRPPKGYAGLRPDLGAFLKSKRQQEGLKQQSVADDIKVSRETLSRIERGRAWPRYDTLKKLTQIFDLKTSDLWIEGRTNRISSQTDSDEFTDMRAQLGVDLQTGRLAEGMTLRDVQALCGISAAQLSRIERCVAPRSRAYEYEFSKAGSRDDRRGVHFKNSEMKRLAEVGANISEADDPDLID